jgi:hypothetical protein
MWKIEDLEWRKYLAYSISCGYIQYNEPKGYGVLEFYSGLFGVVCIEILLETRNRILQLLSLPSNRQMWMLDLRNDAH